MPHAVRGDVDGDGATDVVAVVATPRAPQRCRSWLVVLAGHGAETTPLPAEEQPVLLGLGPIDSRRGLDIVASLHHGASTDFASVFTVTSHGPRLIGRSFPDAFVFAGSVTHLDAVDCERPGSGSIVQTGTAPVGNSSRWIVERHFWRIEATRLRLAGTRRAFVLVERGALPGLPAPQPFPSCLAVRSR